MTNNTTLALDYEKYESVVSYQQYKEDSDNQQTPVWKSINGNTNNVVEVGQQLKFNIYDTELEHPDSIISCELVITREYDNKKRVKSYTYKNNNLALVDQADTQVANFAYINGVAIELTKEQIEHLQEESAFKS